MKKWLVLLSSIFVYEASADILMLDLNNSRSEYAAAKRAAESRGEKVIRIPPITPELEKQFQTSSDQIWTSFVQKRSACEGDAPDADTCGAATATYDAANNDYKKLVSTVPKVDGKMLEQQLATLRTQGTKVSAMIVSGHDGDRDYGGVFSKDINSETIQNAFNKNKPVGDEMRALLLWGCYTGTVADYRDEWRDSFSNLNLIAGFDAMGPKGNRPSSAKYMQDILQKEKRLTEAKTR